MILDTSYLISLFSGERRAFEKGIELTQDDEIQYLPVPVVQELEYGVAMTGSTEEQRNVRNACRLYPPIDLNRETARRAGELLATADTDAGGDAGIDNIDAQVAAIADLLDDAVLTDNVADFERLGVAVESY